MRKFGVTTIYVVVTDLRQPWYKFCTHLETKYCMKQLFIIVVLFHNKISEVKALWGTVNNLKVVINVMSKKTRKK